MTALAILAAWGGILFIAAPARWLLGGCRPLDESAWVEAPFAGIAAIVVILLNGFYSDVPLGRVAPVLTALAAAGWAAMLLRRQIRPSLAACPWGVFGAAGAIYLIQGFGLILVGAHDYVGRAWVDQFNYVSVAQWMLSGRFSETFADVAHRPYVLAAIVKAQERLGQSALHGYLTFLARSDAKTMFEPTILLGPALLAPAGYAVCRRLHFSRKAAVSTAAFAALLPAVASVHLESFLSQSLAMPFLVMLPVVLGRAFETPDACAGSRRGVAGASTSTSTSASTRGAHMASPAHEGSAAAPRASQHARAVRPPSTLAAVALAVLLLAGLTNIYTELYLVVVGVTLLVAAVAGWQAVAAGDFKSFARVVLIAVVLPSASVALAPHSVRVVQRMVGQAMRRGDPSIDRVYPWAYRPEGLRRLWLGDPGATHGVAGYALTLLAGAATGGAILGFLDVAARRFMQAAGRPIRAVQSFAVPLAVLALTGLPWVLLLKDRRHPYQFYKSLLTVAPLLPIGLFQLARRLSVMIRATGREGPAAHALQIVRNVAKPAVAAAFVIVASCTTIMAARSERADDRRSAAKFLLEPDTHQLIEVLGRLHGRDILLAKAVGTWAVGPVNPWLTYAARDNRIWLTRTLLNDAVLDDDPSAAELSDLKTLQHKPLFVWHSGSAYLRPVEGGGSHILMSNSTWTLWEPVDNTWAVLARIDAGATEVADDGTWIRLDNHRAATLYILAGRAGTAIVSGNAPAGAASELRIEPAFGAARTSAVSKGPLALRFSLAAGLNRVVWVNQGNQGAVSIQGLGISEEVR